MTPEFIAILSVGVGLAVFGLAALQFVNKQFERVHERIDRVEERVERLAQQNADRFDQLERRMSSLEQRQARLEGLLDGLREALFARASTSN